MTSVANRNTNGPRLTGTVVSDLHLFTNRTTMDEGTSILCAAGDTSAVVVLNGDIFDFKWSVHGHVERTVLEAERWLSRLAKEYAGCRWVALLGNHDDTPEYRQALTELAQLLPNFAWCDQLLLLGSRAFLHGDVCSGAVTPDELRRYRARFGQHAPRRSWQHQLYWLAARSGVPTVVMRMHSRRRAARRIEQYLRHVLGTGVHNLTDIYFGHVHTPFTDFRHAGLYFHNTGAALVGSRMLPMRFDVRAADLIQLDEQFQLRVDDGGAHHEKA